MTPRARASGVAAATIALLTVLLVPASELTTYAGRSWLLATADVVAGLALLAAGLVTRGRVGLVALLASAAWFAPAWVGWEQAAPLVRSLATAAALFATPLLLHVAVGSASRALYAAAAVGALGLALVHDPFLDANCWANCTDNAFLLHADQSLARVLETGVLIAFLAGGIVVAVRAAGRPTAAFVAASQAAYAGALLLEQGSAPTSRCSRRCSWCAPSRSRCSRSRSCGSRTPRGAPTRRSRDSPLSSAPRRRRGHCEPRSRRASATRACR